MDKFLLFYWDLLSECRGTKALLLNSTAPRGSKAKEDKQATK